MLLHLGAISNRSPTGNQKCGTVFATVRFSGGFSASTINLAQKIDTGTYPIKIPTNDFQLLYLAKRAPIMQTQISDPRTINHA